MLMTAGSAIPLILRGFMDQTTDTIIERITIRSDKPMHLANGEYSRVFYDCIQLTPNDLARLAAEAVGEIPESNFDMVVGVAYSGILFAAAVAGGKQVTILDHERKLQGPDIKGQRIIVADDVVHTMKRVGEAIDIVSQFGGTVVGIACIVHRNGAGKLSVPIWSAYQAGSQ